MKNPIFPPAAVAISLDGESVNALLEAIQFTDSAVVDLRRLADVVRLVSFACEASHMLNGAASVAPDGKLSASSLESIPTQHAWMKEENRAGEVLRAASEQLNVVARRVEKLSTLLERIDGLVVDASINAAQGVKV